MSRRKTKEDKSNQLARNVPGNTVTPAAILDQKLQGTASHVKISGHQMTQHFEGPIPPPETLAQYENIHEGLAERIVQMAEKEQAHRHEKEKREMSAQEENDKRGFDWHTQTQEINRDFGKRGQLISCVIAIVYFVMLSILGFFQLETAVSIGLGTAVVVGLPQMISLLMTSQKMRKTGSSANDPAPAEPPSNWDSDPN